jgi:hypothetical protein
MSSTARKTLDTDIITLRTIYARGTSNAYIPSSFVLMSDGVGGTSWTNTSTITQPLQVGQNYVRGTQQDYDFDASGYSLTIPTNIPLQVPSFYNVNVKGLLYMNNYSFTSAGMIQLGLQQSQGQTSSPSIYIPFNTYAGYIDSTKRNNVSVNYNTILQTQLPYNSSLANTLQLTASTLSTATLYTGLRLKIDQVTAQQMPTLYQFP